ncbi:hypothetical protein TRVL_01236 [Trypanosoma vivax]|nr:hypothetical protein TRVL_01236 [Trypanosoma vivax]
MLQLLLTVLIVTCNSFAFHADAFSRSYYLQRRIGESGKWEPVTSFTISRHSPDSPAKLKQKQEQATEGRELTGEEKNALSIEQFVRYRLLPEGGNETREAVSLALSPCSILRGFEAADSRSIHLRETLAVAVGPGATVVGLQASSLANRFHAHMLEGDQCDVTVLSLFPQVRIYAAVGLLSPVVPRSTPNYTELNAFTFHGIRKEVNSKKASKKKKEHMTKANAPHGDEGNDNFQYQTGEEGEEEEEDRRTFLEKYWMFFAAFLVINVIQGFASSKSR